MGAAYFHVSIDGDFFAEIKPRIPEWVILGVKTTLSDLHQTIDFIGQRRCIHFLLENPEFPWHRFAGNNQA